MKVSKRQSQLEIVSAAFLILDMVLGRPLQYQVLIVTELATRSPIRAIRGIREVGLGRAAAAGAIAAVSAGSCEAARGFYRQISVKQQEWVGCVGGLGDGGVGDGGWRLEVGGWRLEVGGWRLEVGGWRLGVGGWGLGLRVRGWWGLRKPCRSLRQPSVFRGCR